MVKREHLIEKFGSEEAVSEHYRAMQLKSRETYVKNGSKGGFRGVSKEKRKEISKLGVEARQKKG